MVGLGDGVAGIKDLPHRLTLGLGKVSPEHQMLPGDIHNSPLPTMVPALKSRWNRFIRGPEYPLNHPAPGLLPTDAREVFSPLSRWLKLVQYHHSGSLHGDVSLATLHPASPPILRSCSYQISHGRLDPHPASLELVAID